MGLTFCNVHFTKQPQRVVYVSGELMKSLKLSGKKNIRLRLGKDAIPAMIKPIKRAGKHLFLASGVKSAIKVPKSGGIYLRNLQNDEVQLGPLVGVLSDGPASAAQPFGSRTGFIKQLLREGSNKCYIFAFMPRDIDWQQEQVNGYFLTAGGKFERKMVPARMSSTTVCPAAERRLPHTSTSCGSGSDARRFPTSTGASSINRMFTACWRMTVPPTASCLKHTAIPAQNRCAICWTATTLSITNLPQAVLDTASTA